MCPGHSPSLSAAGVAGAASAGDAAGAVVRLDEIGRKDSEEFGGKAAMLGAMRSAGLPTFDGVAISTRSYLQAIVDGGAEDLVRRFWEIAWSDNAAERGPHGALSEEIARRLADADLSALLDLTLARLREAGVLQPTMIVRSSATGEDSTRLSYAGQFVSQKCRGDRGGLNAAIAAVWASCTAPHLPAYHAAMKMRQPSALPAEQLAMGVVVQPFNTFSLAGLLFTQHPTVPVRDWTLLEYLDTDPARIVLGEVQPHRCRVSADAGHVVWERRVDGRPVLSADETRQLIEGGAKLKDLVGADVDIEWGVRSGTPYFLQCRPATTVPSDAA